MSSRITKWIKNRDSARKLADCYNQWDDDDSWPGGFNQGIKFTEDRILERPFTPLVAYVSVYEDQFVGYIDAYQHGTDTDTLFVGLLGVSPEFQGKGYGRDLLKKVNEFAAKKKCINRIELGTWAGNTKSVPTYKRTGYKWAPETLVLMVNYLPGILNFPLFKDYFSANDYYKTLLREIKQEPDEERFENMDVFSYKFENDKGERIEALIDRNSKRMTGFTVKGEIGLWCLLDSHEGYIGYGVTRVTWRVQNTSKKELKMKIKARGSGGLVIDRKIDLEIVVPPEKTVEHEALVKLTADTKLKSLQEFSPRYESTIVTEVELENKEFLLITAQKPVKTFKLSSFPEIPILSSSNKLQHVLQLTNATQDKLKMKVTIPAREKLQVELLSPKTLELQSASAVNLKIAIHASEELETGVMRIPVKLVLLEHDITLLEHFFILVSRQYDVTGHCNVENPVNEPFFLQNAFTRVNFSDNPPFGITRIDNLITGHFMDYFGPDIDLGPPYEGFFNEWQRPDKNCQLKIDTDADQSSAAFTYQAKSSRFPLNLEKKINLKAGFPGYMVKIKLTNTSDKTIKVDFKAGLGTNNAFSTLICPHVDGLTIFNSGGVNYPGDIKNPSQFFHENWYCLKYSHGMISGVIWEDSRHYLSMIRLQGSYNEFRWEKISIKPESSIDVGFKVLIGTGNWEVIRGYWLKDRGTTRAGPYHGGMIPSDSLEVKILTDSFHPAIISSLIQNLKVRISTLGENPVKGTLYVKLLDSEMVKRIETSLQVEKLTTDSSFEQSFPIYIQPGHEEQKILSGSTILETRYADIVKPFKLLLYPEKDINIIGPEIFGDDKQITINNGYLNYKTDTTGSINFLTAVGKDENLLESRFPDRNASFVFFNPFIGGITPLVKFFGTREKEILVDEQARFQIEKYIPKETVPWQGVKTNYRTTGAHPGLIIAVEHVTLPGVNFIKSRIILENQKDEFLLLRFGFFVFLAAKGVEPPKAEIINSKGQIVKKISTQYHKPPKDEQWLQMTTSDPDIKLGFIPDGPTSCKIDLFTAGDKIRCVRVYMGHKIEPLGKAEITMYTILLKNNEKVTDYLFLREWDTSKYTDTEKGSENLEMIDFPVFYG
ncbi:MAG: GNAT family N-acetyltransferase [Candidatus Hodarchaeales archaeon]|jgi:GNAT superfamily N-acetyltransferase